MIFDRREVGVTRLDILIVWQQQFDAFYEPRPKVRNTALSLSLSLSSLEIRWFPDASEPHAAAALP